MIVCCTAILDIYAFLYFNVRVSGLDSAVVGTRDCIARLPALRAKQAAWGRYTFCERSVRLRVAGINSEFRLGGNSKFCGPGMTIEQTLMRFAKGAGGLVEGRMREKYSKTIWLACLHHFSSVNRLMYFNETDSGSNSACHPELSLARKK